MTMASIAPDSQLRPPGVDIAPRILQRTVLVVQMMADGATAARACIDHGLHADGVEHARGRGIDRRRHRRLGAAVEQQHLARMRTARPRARRARGLELGTQCRRHRNAQRAPQLQCAAEQPAPRQAFAQQPVEDAFIHRAPHLGFHHRAADIQQMAVVDAGRAGGLAGAAGEAAIQVQLRAAGRGGALEHLLDLVDAPARTIQFVTEQLVGGAGRIAEPAVHAGAQDRVGGIALRRSLDPIGEPGFHDDALQIRDQPAAD